jgi:hypothetical protein
MTTLLAACHAPLLAAVLSLSSLPPLPLQALKENGMGNFSSVMFTEMALFSFFFRPPFSFFLSFFFRVRSFSFLPSFLSLASHRDSEREMREGVRGKGLLLLLLLSLSAAAAAAAWTVDDPFLDRANGPYFGWLPALAELPDTKCHDTNIVLYFLTLGDMCSG